MPEKEEEFQSLEPDKEDPEVLVLRIRPDLYRAFQRCVWMTIHETGMTPDEVHNLFIEELLSMKEC